MGMEAQHDSICSIRHIYEIPFTVIYLSIVNAQITTVQKNPKTH